MFSRSRTAELCFLIVIVGVLSSSCGDEFTFRVVVDRSVEEVFWQSVEDSTSPLGLRAYLERWPDGRYAPLARRRLATIDDPSTLAAAPVSVEPDPPLVAGPVSVEGDPVPMESGATFRDCADCPEMVVVPSGAFRMGSIEGPVDERPVREVRVEMFALGRHETTREEFGAFAAATGYAGDGCSVIGDDGSLDWDDRASWRNPDFPQGALQPVVCVSWEGRGGVRAVAEPGDRGAIPIAQRSGVGVRSPRRYRDQTILGFPVWQYVRARQRQ